MRSKKFIVCSMMIGLFVILSAACGGSGEKKTYTGTVNDALIPTGSTYAKSQIEHKDVEAVIESVGKTERHLSFKSKDGLKLGDCEQPIKFDWIEADKKAYFSTCKRVGTGETRNIGGGTSTVKMDGQKITIEINIDDHFYTFRGEQKP